MFDKELMKQLATIPAENRAEWFAERDKLHALAAEMNPPERRRDGDKVRRCAGNTSSGSYDKMLSG